MAGPCNGAFDHVPRELVNSAKLCEFPVLARRNQELRRNLEVLEQNIAGAQEVQKTTASIMPIMMADEASQSWLFMDRLGVVTRIKRTRRLFVLLCFIDQIASKLVNGQ